MWYSLPLLSFFLIWGHYTDKWRCLFSVIICGRSCNSFISPVIFTLQLDTIISFGEELVQRNIGEYFVFKIDWVHNERNQYMKVELQLKTSVIILNLKMKFKPHNSIGRKVSYIKELFIPCCMKIWNVTINFARKGFITKVTNSVTDFMYVTSCTLYKFIYDWKEIDASIISVVVVVIVFYDDDTEKTTMMKPVSLFTALELKNCYTYLEKFAEI